MARSTRSRSILVVSSTPTPPPSPPHRYDKVRCCLLFNELLSRSTSFLNQLSKKKGSFSFSSSSSSSWRRISMSMFYLPSHHLFCVYYCKRAKSANCEDMREREKCWGRDTIENELEKTTSLWRSPREDVVAYAIEKQEEEERRGEAIGKSAYGKAKHRRRTRPVTIFEAAYK